MTLSPIERHLLINQYEILKRLDHWDHFECKRYDKLLSMLRSGYDKDFVDLMTQGDRKPLSDDVRREVHDIIHMFQLLGPANGTPAANFAGFSRHDECEYHDYAMLVLEAAVDIFPVTMFDYDPLYRTLPAYRAMLKEWRTSEDPENLTDDDVKRINAKGRWSEGPPRKAQDGR